MAAGSIIIDLLMRTGSFETDTKRAEKRLAELKKEAQKAGATIGAAFSAVAVASAYMVKSSIDAMDQMSKLAQKTGVTTEQLSALAYAADLSGVSQEQLADAMVKLSKGMSDAAMGTGEAAKGFEALGINIKQADGTLKSADQVLGEVADKFAGFRDGAEKTALAVNLFGRSGAQLIPLLNAGASGLDELKREAADLGLVLGGDTARAAEAFNDNLSRVKGAVQGVSDYAAAELLPTLVQVSEQFVELAKNQTFIETAAAIVKAAIGGLITVFQTIAVVGSDVGFVFLSVGREIGAWAAQINALAHGDLKGFRAISDAVKADGERARAELDKFQARIMAIGQPKWRDPRILGDPGSIAQQTAGWKKAAPALKGNNPAGSKDRISEAERYMQSLQKQLDKTKDLSVAEQVLLDVQRGRLGTVSEAQKRALLDVAGQIDAAKRLEDQFKAEAAQVDAWRDAQARLKAEGAAVYDEMRTPLERLQDEQSRLMRLYDEGVITLETYGRALKKVSDDYDAAADSAKTAVDEMDGFTKRLAKNVQDHLGDGLYQIMDGNFKNIGRSFLQMLQRMAADAMAADLARKMFGGSVQGGSGLGWIGSIFSGLRGSGPSDGGIGGLGGINAGLPAYGLATGTNYVPYDNFPARLHKGEAVVPAKYNPAAGGALPRGGAGAVQIINNGPPMSAREESQQQPDGTQLRRIVLDVIADDFARGGRVSQAGQAQFGWSRQMPRRA